MEISSILGLNRHRPNTEERELATQQEDLVTVLLSLCMAAGVTADGWAHKNVIETLEGFFTPWHGLLYAGFSGTAAWTFFLAYRRRDRYPVWWRDGWPAGYRVGVLGIGFFALGGLGDMIWHEALGIEIGLLPSFSPSHALVTIGGVLLVTSPLRSWWAANDGPRRAATGVASLALAAVAATVLLTYVSAFMTTGPMLPYEPALGDYGGIVDTHEELQAVQGVASYLVTTLLVGIPLLLVHRRHAALGTGTALVAGVSLYFMVINQMPPAHLLAAVGAVCGAAVADVLLLRLDEVRGSNAMLRLPLAGGLFATLVWSGHLIGLHLGDGVRWPPEMWAGIVVLTSVLGVLLGGLAARPVDQRF
jgi:hypothetical protein